jgi:hypothetical protein
MGAVAPDGAKHKDHFRIGNIPDGEFAAASSTVRAR